MRDVQNMVNKNPSKDLICSEMETDESGLGSFKEVEEAFAPETHKLRKLSHQKLTSSALRDAIIN